MAKLGAKDWDDMMAAITAPPSNLPRVRMEPREPAGVLRGLSSSGALQNRARSLARIELDKARRHHAALLTKQKTINPSEADELDREIIESTYKLRSLYDLNKK